MITYSAAKRQMLKIEIQKTIYGPFSEKSLFKLNQIIDSFALQHPRGNSAFMYKGAVYAKEGYRPKGRISLLNRELYPRMEKWLEEAKDCVQEQFTVSNYLTCAVMLSFHAKDLCRLLPDCLHSVINKEADESEILSEEVIQKFLEQNQEHAMLVKKRMLINLIS